MSLPVRVPHLTVEEYLEGELTANIRHEYIAGQVFAMAGASDVHNLIAGNIYARLRAHLRGSPCRAFISDMKAQVEAADTFYYPDVIVTCDPQDTEAYYKTRPCLIVEVLSPGTEAIDRREKLVVYRKLESLREYVLVAQDERRIEVYRRDLQGVWHLETLGPDDELRFESLPPGVLRMTMAEVYEDASVVSE
jgi:Uma2 family endonuclease